MRVMIVGELVRTWAAAGLLVFPARRKLRELEAENAELRGRTRDLERFRGMAVDVTGSLFDAGRRAGHSRG